MASELDPRQGHHIGGRLPIGGKDTHPAARYASPADIARDNSLSSFRKLAHLEAWQEDVQARLDTTSEGMPPNGRTSMDLALLGEIETARRLVQSQSGADRGSARSVPQKVDPIDARQGSRSQLTYRILVNSMIAITALVIAVLSAWWIMSTI